MFDDVYISDRIYTEVLPGLFPDFLDRAWAKYLLLPQECIRTGD